MKIRNIHNKINQSILDRIGDIVDRIIFYGSRVQGNYEDSSDYDVLIILNEEVDWRLEWQIYDICLDICLEYDVLIDVKVISSFDLDTIKGRQPYIQEAIETGIIL